MVYYMGSTLNPSKCIHLSIGPPRDKLELPSVSNVKAHGVTIASFLIRAWHCRPDGPRSHQTPTPQMQVSCLQPVPRERQPASIQSAFQVLLLHDWSPDWKAWGYDPRVVRFARLYAVTKQIPSRHDLFTIWLGEARRSSIFPGSLHFSASLAWLLCTILSL